MTPRPHPKRKVSPVRETDGKTWTLITHRSKGTELTLDDEARTETQQQPTEAEELPSRRPMEFPPVNQQKFNRHPPFKSFSWHQDHASSNLENRRLIGHPDVLYKSYRKKRKRGLPMSDDDEETSSSESELDTESDSALCSDSGEDRETEHFEDSATAETALLRKDLVEFIYTLFVIWMASIRYIIPPDHRLKRPKKRTRMLIEETDPNDPSTVLISPFDGYYHLACPFYLSNPIRHKTCVMKHSLRSIEDLVAHIEKSHAEPPLCRICGKIFQTFPERNDHLRDETCEQPKREGQIPHGVSQLQRVKILKCDNPRTAEEDRWTRIYKVIFEAKPEANMSPYLMDGEGLRFSLLNDYWRLKGKECVKKYLADHGHARHGECEGAEFAGLCSLVLGDLREKVLEERTCSE